MTVSGSIRLSVFITAELSIPRTNLEVPLLSLLAPVPGPHPPRIDVHEIRAGVETHAAPRSLQRSITQPRELTSDETHIHGAPLHVLTMLRDLVALGMQLRVGPRRPVGRNHF